MKILNDFLLCNSVFNHSSKNTIFSKNFVKNSITIKTNNVSFGSAEVLPDCAHKVDETLYRGCRPSKYDFSPLKDLGIKTIIDLSTEPRDIDEEAYSNKYGMKYVAMPIDSFEWPDDNQLKEFFNIFKEAKDKGEKVYVHCLFGRDRTGLMVNMYKIYYNMPIQKTFDIEYARDILKGFLKRTNYK